MERSPVLRRYRLPTSTIVGSIASKELKRRCNV
jgi:hypothetical protein